jgi:two-component system, LytTR family, sensor kinase
MQQTEMQMAFKIKNLWLVHALGWILFLVLPLTIVSREPSAEIYSFLLKSWSFWAFFLIYLFIFYSNTLFFLPRLFLREKHLLYFIIFLTGFLLTFYFQPFENLIFQKYRHAGSYAPVMENDRFRPPPPGEAFERDFRPPPPGYAGREANRTRVDFVSLVLFLVVWVVAMATVISEQWQLSEKRAILSEADKAQAELSFFKAQINPHFLFNTLNNIYSLAVGNSQHTAPSIMKLSRMMRYITEEATEDFVPLEDEIMCLENYVDLQKLRLNAKTNVDFRYDLDYYGVRIAPLILMTFVENAFKFGVSNRFENLIEIRINVYKHIISFSCKNQIFEPDRNKERQGIGIANTRKRLDFLYADRYALKITSKENHYEVFLELRDEGPERTEGNI